MKKLSLLLLLITIFSFKLADIQSIYKIPLEANAVVAKDIDLDGDFDLIINHGYSDNSGWGGIYFLENNGHGYFTPYDSAFDNTGEWELSVDTVINKTYPDVVYLIKDSVAVVSISNLTDRLVVYSGPKASEFDLGDFDGNGELDVVYISNNYFYLGIIYNYGNRQFSVPETVDFDHPLLDVATCDFDKNGLTDFVVAGTNCYVYSSFEEGFIVQQLAFGAGNVKITDLDIDGDEDIITFSDIIQVSHVRSYENNDDNFFDTVSTFKVPMGCTDFSVTDFNNDSLPDLLFLSHDFNKGMLIYYNKGNFRFGDSVEITLEYYDEARRFITCADMDGNGYQDIVLTRQVFYLEYAPSYLEILFNDGNGNFGENPLTGITDNERNYQQRSLNSFPNPFTDKTTIQYQTDKQQQVRIDIYDLKGRKIKSLFNQILYKGNHQFEWNGISDNGLVCGPGVYFIILKTANNTHSCKLIKQS